MSYYEQSKSADMDVLHDLATLEKRRTMINLTPLPITTEVAHDSDDTWITARVRELPVSAYAPNEEEAKTMLVEGIAAYAQELSDLDSECAECGHFCGEHFTSNNGVVRGCAGGDDDEPCLDCDGFVYAH